MAMTPTNTPDPAATHQASEKATLSVTFSIKELEAMLGNAKAGGSVEVLIEVTRELILR